ncbi:MAG: hypothetical protein OEV72_05860 [Thermoleophilia bacterium]|nr:hypothetical protein [Thermoleophilia bacterium]MDH5294103.1 hypothetical protein [Acidimicrobiia bacterium]
MTRNSVAFPIGAASDLTPLFSYQPSSVTLADGIAHTINQTLLRDLYYGAWAHVWVDKSSQCQVTIASPNPTDDLTRYETQIPAFIAAARAGLEIYTASASKLPATGVSFLPPFGLSMLNTKSIQLLHYPPTETLDYLDYLYSPTNRRWESLLGYNGFPGAENTLVETIVDLIPIAAGGGSAGSTALEPVENAFVAYAQQMLDVYLRPSPSGKATQPIVAYGEPVRAFLEANFDQSELEVLSVISLRLMTGGPTTPVLCANHPSDFLSAAGRHETAEPSPADQKYPPQDPKAILLQDLKAARWQTTMSQNPDADPKQTLQDASDYWDQNPDLVAQIFAEQMSEFES